MVSELLGQIVDELTAGKKPLGSSLVVLVGVPLAGKSTLAEKLAAYGMVHVWATRIRKQHDMTFQEIVPELPRIVERLLEGGYAVVVDHMNHTKALREPYLALAERYKAACQIIWVDPKPEEIERRRRAVESTGGSEGRSVVRPEWVAIAQDEFEKPHGRYLRIEEVTENFFQKVLKGAIGTKSIVGNGLT